MINKILFSLVVSITICSIFTVLSYRILLWLNPPRIIIGGQIRSTMPLGATIFSMLAGGITALIAFVIAFRRAKMQAF